MSFIGILFLSATAVCFSLTSGQKIFYVHPNGDQSQCPVNGGDCYTLNEYFAVSNKSFADEETIFDFLPGNHSLNNSIDISLSSNVAFYGMPGGSGLLDSPVVIHCTAENVAIKFKSCSNVQFQNITIRNCGKRVTSLTGYSESALVMLFVLNANIHYVSIQDSPGAALVLIDSFNILISTSSFYFNNRYSSYNESASVAVLYDSVQASSNSNNPLNFVMHHSNITNDHFIGLYIGLMQFENLVNIHLESIYAANNAFLNIFIYSVTDKYDLSITALQSAGSLSGVILSQIETFLQEHVPSISIVNSSLSNHQGNGLIVLWYSSLSGLFYLGYSSFTSNAGIIGTALLVAADRNPSSQGNFDVILDNVTFDSNALNRTFADVFGLNPSVSATTGFSNGKNLSIINCTFSNNEGSGLGIFNTYTTFYGVNNFINNSAEIGGGIIMISTSFLFFTPGSLVNFIGNHAKEKGGAINVEQIVLLFTTTEFLFSESNLVINPCFYKLDYANLTEKHLYFESNTAGVAGAVLYGGDTSVCIQAGFSEISTFSNQEDTFSIISSDPRGVCFCIDGVPNCKQKSLSISAIPGDNIEFSVVVIGQDENATTGIISVSSDSQARPNNYNSHAACTNLTHEIKIQDNSINKVTVNVTIGNFQTNFFQHPLTIDVDIDPCLTGTYLSPISHVCECEESIKAATTNCIGVNATVTKKDIHGWIGNYDNCTIVYPLCPYDYCIHSESPVTYPLDDPDEQCALDRSGLLCGRCDEGFSLMLGSNKCGECTNNYLSLIIPFSLAGIALVMLLIALNITVTVGTINGLLFFANVVKIFQPLLLGIDSNIPVLSQFIDWINLDFGIETCFFDGMNACAKTGLQFVFPFYLWLLFLLTVLLSRRFSKLSQLIGNNVVPVLCTLLLLSYTKLLRTVISIFIYSTLSTGCINQLVWYIDGEPFLSRCHLILFIVALSLLVLLISPYVLFLLLFPLWEKSRSKWHIGTRLFIKLKPFFDAYAGPHTDIFRFWPGLLLVARIIIATAIVTTSSSNIISISVAVIAILLVTLSFGSVYKKKIIHMLDVCYFMLLLIIFYIIAGTIGDDSEVRSHAITRKGATNGIAIMLSLSLLGFLCIMTYHIYALYRLGCCCFDKCDKIKHKKDKNLSNIAAINSSRDSHTSMESSVDVPQLREPLLESI